MHLFGMRSLYLFEKVDLKSEIGQKNACGKMLYGKHTNDLINFIVSYHMYI